MTIVEIICRKKIILIYFSSEEIDDSDDKSASEPLIDDEFESKTEEDIPIQVQTSEDLIVDEIVDKNTQEDDLIPEEKGIFTFSRKKNIFSKFYGKIGIISWLLFHLI